MKTYLRYLAIALLIVVALFSIVARAQNPDDQSLQIPLPVNPNIPSDTTTLPNATAAETAQKQAATSGQASSLEAVANVINNTFGGAGQAGYIEKFKQSGLTIAGDLGAIALGLGGVLALVSLVWAVMIAMASNQSAMDAAIESVIFASLTAFLLLKYPSIVEDIMSLATSLLGKIDAGGLGAAVTKFIQSFFMSFVGVVIEGIKGMSFTDWINKAADLIFGLLLMAVACYFAFLALIELVGVLLIGPVVVGIAIAVGPIFVACIASSYTRRWFDQWLNFLVGGAFLSVITLIVLRLLNEVITSQLLSMAGGGVSGQALAIALLGMGCAKIFSGIPGFADALLPGRTGAGSALTGGKNIAAAGKAAATGATSAGKATAAVGGAAKTTAAAVTKSSAVGAVMKKFLN